jgi:hypothetical protein
VERLAVFDVIPILEGWARSDERFAQTYWPWILLAQKEPLPENYLLGSPEAVFRKRCSVSKNALCLGTSSQLASPLLRNNHGRDCNV